MKDVIVRLGNGLGNQLFTYAAAFTFAKKNNAKLYIDDESGFYKRYKYELHNFNVTAEMVEKKYKFLGISGRIKRRILKRLNHYIKDKFFLIEQMDNEKRTYYNPKQLDINFKKRLYFEGHFQSEKYFLPEKKNLLKEFSFKNEIINQQNPFIKMIRNNNSVSIHIRQDTFLPNQGHKNLSKLNAEDLKNYINIIKRGVKYFDNNLDAPQYFLWSNNFNGLRELFPSEKFIFVDANLKNDPAYDLYLMSLCKHFVLSPSTFHYWAANLSMNSRKVCLAPIYKLNKRGYYGFSNNKNIKAEWWREI